MLSRIGAVIQDSFMVATVWCRISYATVNNTNVSIVDKPEKQLKLANALSTHFHNSSASKIEAKNVHKSPANKNLNVLQR